MRKVCAVVLLMLLLNISAMADYVNSEDGLIVRKEPSISSEELGVLSFAKEVTGTVINNWMYISEYQGWICTDYIQEESPLDSMVSMGVWHITAYTWTGYRCANGNYPSDNYTIACNSLPFGTKVYIQDVGFRVVEDRGPTWLGSNWCDLYNSDYNSCVQWGSQYKEVWIIQ